ncbi:hypothetical protein [Streptomyces sp. NPDC047009]|uniref:hypothetical protein n=1 Tax=Streptomyces sp. NPDC047009 TaxID=3154496 RepID=UPI0033F83308
MRLAVQPGPALGDDAVTLDATGDVQGHALTIRLVDIRIGSSMAVFASFDFKAAKVPAVPQLLMAKQVEKLKAAPNG